MMRNNNSWVVVVVVIIIIIVLSSCFGRLTSKPENLLGVIDSEVMLNCSTSRTNGTGTLYWLYRKSSLSFKTMIYDTTKGLASNMDDFSISGKPDLGEYNLIIKSVRLQHGGTYMCEEKEGESATVELIVFSDNPVCRSAVNGRRGEVREKSVTLLIPEGVWENDTITFICRVNYTGNSSLTYKWNDQDQIRLDNEEVTPKQISNHTVNDISLTEIEIEINVLASRPEVPPLLVYVCFSSKCLKIWTSPRLNIFDPVSNVTIITSWASANNSDGVVLRCSSNGYPSPSYSWYVKGVFSEGPFVELDRKPSCLHDCYCTAWNTINGQNYSVIANVNQFITGGDPSNDSTENDISVSQTTITKTMGWVTGVPKINGSDRNVDGGVTSVNPMSASKDSTSTSSDFFDPKNFHLHLYAIILISLVALCISACAVALICTRRKRKNFERAEALAGLTSLSTLRDSPQEMEKGKFNLKAISTRRAISPFGINDESEMEDTGRRNLRKKNSMPTYSGIYDEIGDCYELISELEETSGADDIGKYERIEAHDDNNKYVTIETGDVNKLKIIDSDDVSKFEIMETDDDGANEIASQYLTTEWPLGMTDKESSKHDRSEELSKELDESSKTIHSYITVLP